ncbi:hypothetical protein ACQDBC_002451 [Proteus mirabilis]|nr:hypothetical protein [Proteus mirabilis]HEK1813435.1 hypothetical protein [Proteus mirabilis]HEK2080164.1 hypothetical protein [Proteus mirabilis]HEK3015199.1 hypothetical protein [Proteus mirabilis]
MSNQNLEVLVNTLSAQVVSQGYQIAELQKQLASMQLTSCFSNKQYKLQSVENHIGLEVINFSVFN